MKRFAIFAFIVFAAGTASAWEAQTTQIGLAEQAALGSRLHKRLELIGFTGGLFEPLTIPPADAPSLIADLHLLSPTHGEVPDARGRQTALAWIAAGAAIADVPEKYAANHFYDPTTGRGFEKPDRSLFDVVDGVDMPDHGEPAPDWVVDAKNPFNVNGFYDQYAKAITAATPGERSRAMAGALLVAGATMHVLGDLGAPARVRGDSAAQLDKLGGGVDDRGSRFERIAALAYGRLGVPAASRVITRTHLRDYFTSRDGTGLADEIARSYFSPHTLPEPTHVTDEARPKLVKPAPTLPAKLNLMAGSRETGTTLRNADGTCLARYKVEDSTLKFWLDDDCMLDEVGKILPEVVAYEQGLLDFLLRGELAVAVSSQVVVSAKGLGDGTLELLVEDDRGVRRSIGTFTIKAGMNQLAKVAAPTSGTRVIAMYRGYDLAGEPLVAVGALPLTTK
ncbi:MAG TPA: hypothetical protein VGG74_38300 [Kofleriaceae bacterium]|jgi:hypothetical protein